MPCGPHPAGGAERLLPGRGARDDPLLLSGSVWSCKPQRLYPFEARLKLGRDRVESYEVSFGDASAREGAQFARPRAIHEWMIRVAGPESPKIPD